MPYFKILSTVLMCLVLMSCGSANQPVDSAEDAQEEQDDSNSEGGEQPTPVDPNSTEEVIETSELLD